MTRNTEELQAWMRCREKFFQQVDKAREGNRGADPKQVKADIEEAVAAVHTARHRNRGAGRLPESHSGSRLD